ncbi:uncharacterized protein LOC127530552 [Acanthochromis polyacanthus]|uniref:uncharacterized protein LOC127530552 n=1 Tax=Acanthochromis polyacanthus TaxID=80966 RepID=UPI0022347649|nr:uncharacterized protein LOC127530552 [Acanthochromis polyacanthus]XP_051793568.1 uncharacterized protein LOC127530552 [Acanthochromis polyacanthus]XP_051793569.1 uncharacterized protein LOC127530552 [Acanthochromis polyacanthus]
MFFFFSCGVNFKCTCSGRAETAVLILGISFCLLPVRGLGTASSSWVWRRRRLRDLMSQLKAENERLRQQWAADVSGAASSSSAASARQASAAAEAAAVTERLVVIPRDRKCSMFNGRSGIEITEWIEEIEACMRTRRLSIADQALFIFDHLEGEAKEIRFWPSRERGDPPTVFAILKDLYGCAQSHVILQQAFFSRRQLDGETLQEFSLALLALMERVKQCVPDGMPNADQLLRDQFTEHVLDSALRRELKQFVRGKPDATLLELRSEAIRWEREGLPGGARGRSVSLPAVHGFQYGVQGHLNPVQSVALSNPDWDELMELMKQQQEQLNQLTQTVASLHAPYLPNRTSGSRPVICRRCQQPGHFA